jgi:hypothetical protein
MPDRVTATLVGHIFVGATGAGAASGRPYEEKSKAKTQSYIGPVVNAGPYVVLDLRKEIDYGFAGAG